MADKVGPQGWWVDDKNVDVEKTIKAEQAKLDELGQVAPAMLAARPAKGIDSTMLTAFQALQAVDGITNGVDMRYLEPMAFDGEFLRWLPQIIGSCVESGRSRAAVSRTLAEILIHSQLEGTFGDGLTGRNNIASFGPYTYRASREIAGLSGGDGSFCGAMIDAMRRYGQLPCDTPGIVSDAFPEPQNPNTYRRFGNSNSILNEFADVGRKWKLLESSRLTSADQFKAACVDQFKPAMICSMWAFSARERHPNWVSDGSPVYIYKRSREQWAHNMTLIGCVEVDNEWYAIVRNSWGSNAHSGRDWFPIPLGVLDAWLRDRQTVSMTIGELDLPDTPNIVT